ncbi:lipocalin-like domain-containing protein [Maribacter ulvicola]|uniref:Lipocalin-like n=1 Tax=Maribacter ulvicola TaxID=228959 RepID=A0A1N6PSI7_9FLAO|nr:lipocalin family protein [Maribacter ulvicola]SIQ07284.1 Lipocalin-like [Maribacter ulvicola]
MTKKISKFLLIALIALSACKEAKNSIQKEKVEKPVTLINEKLLIGSWLDQSESKLHFSLFKDGTASSDNMATLLYKKWKLDGTKLILTAKSIGNGNSSTDDETYQIKTLTEEKMVLQNGNYLLEFVKKKQNQDRTNSINTDYAVLTVTKVEPGKDGYTATLKNDFGDLYTTVISIPNLEKEYKELKVGEKVKIIGDYGNGTPIPIKAKKILIIKE